MLGGGVCVCQIPIHTLITYSNHTVTLQTHVSLLIPCYVYTILYYTPYILNYLITYIEGKYRENLENQLSGAFKKTTCNYCK